MFSNLLELAQKNKGVPPIYLFISPHAPGKPIKPVCSWTCLPTTNSNVGCIPLFYPLTPYPTEPLYSGDLKSGLVCILNGPIEVGLQMVWILNGIWHLEAQPFEIWTNSNHCAKNHLKSGFWMVGTKAICKAQPIENRNIWNPTFKKSRFQCFQILNGWISDLQNLFSKNS